MMDNIPSTSLLRNFKTKKEKETFARRFSESSDVLKEIKKLIEEDIQTLSRKREGNTDYTLPSWDYLQADLNGSIRSLRKILNYLPK